MNAVIGLFKPDQLPEAINHLTNSGISRSDLSTVSTAANIPDYLEGDPKDAAVGGAEIGAVTGGAMGAIGSVVLSGIPGMEATAVSGLLATAAGAAMGGYFGSLYNTRAETQEGMTIEETLEDGDILLIVRTTAEQSAQIAALLEQTGGHDVEAHEVPEEAAE